MWCAFVVPHFTLRVSEAGKQVTRLILCVRVYVHKLLIKADITW